MDVEQQPSPYELVDSFAFPQQRFPAFQAIVAQGPAALPAVRAGLRSPNWQVRRWCAICLDHVADSESLVDLIPLLSDPKSDVRLWAVHALACDHCKDNVQCEVDLVPLLIQRVEADPSVRVRRMATIMLGTEFADLRAVPVFERLLCQESDPKLRLHAQAGLRRLQTSRQ